MHETRQSSTPPPEFVSHQAKYPNPRTTTSFYSSTQILIPIVVIPVFLFQVRETFENIQISLQIKRYENDINLNISCETVQLLHLNNKISDCSLLSWRTPDQVKCTTNTFADNSTNPNYHSRCTIQCSTETFTKVQDENRIEWIKITQWLNIESPGLSHSGDYSCYLNRTYGKLAEFEFREKTDRACQYDDQCQSRICHQNRCRCHSANENYLPEIGKCIQRKKLGDSCQFDKQCHFNEYQVHSALVGFRPNFTQLICHFSKCQCPLGSVKYRIANNQFCISKASNGEPCFANAQCKSQSEYCFHNYEDNTDTCQCKDGYRWSQDECVTIRKCVGEKDCEDGQLCDQGVCRCKDGFRWKLDECEPHRTCDSTSNCEDGQFCDQGNQGVCRCKDGFRWKQGKCVQIRKCVGKEDCGDGQHCEQNVCKCVSLETMDSQGKCSTNWKIISIIIIVVVVIFLVTTYYLLSRKFTTKPNSQIPQASSTQIFFGKKRKIGNYELKGLKPAKDTNSTESSDLFCEDGKTIKFQFHETKFQDGEREINC